MKKAWVNTLIVFTLIGSISAQQRTAHISFRKVDHDFKTVKEANGSVSVVFSFINTGGAPVTLQNVTASCGCTTPDYTKSPIMPGDSGFVKATYDPNGRPGSFAKEITVVSNADNSPLILKINGSVTPKEQKIEDMYHYSMGNLRLETGHLGLGKINFGTSQSGKFKVVNSGSKDLMVGFFKLPAWLKVKSGKIILKPKETTDIEITYNTVKKMDWGFLIDYIYLTIDGKQDPNYKLTVTADVVEDFSKLSPAQKANAPKIQFENTNFDYSSVAEGIAVEYDFKFVNTGKSELKIRKVSSTCVCATAIPKDIVIKPGGSSSIKAKFDTKGYRNSQTKTFTVMSNDPASPQITLWLKGMVK